MNVDGLRNCFRHTVRWALRFSKAHTASQGQRGGGGGGIRAITVLASPCTVHYTSALTGQSLKDCMELNPLPGPVISKAPANCQLKILWITIDLFYSQVSHWTGYREIVGKAPKFPCLQSIHRNCLELVYQNSNFFLPHFW